MAYMSDLKRFNNYKKNGVVEKACEPQKRKGVESFQQPSLFTVISTTLGLYLLLTLGYINSLLFTPKVAREKNRDGYPKLYEPFDLLFMRFIYRRIRDCFNQPICSVAAPEVILKDRVTRDFCWTFQYPGTVSKCLNLVSFNYLGFAETSGACAEASKASIMDFGTSMCSSAHELGTTPLHEELEALTAEFLGVEDAIVFGMGFATSALNIASLAGPDTLVLSDEKNHASLILGLRLSGACIKVFKHNNVKSLESVLRKSVARAKSPWKKILIVVEGIYSMEGTIVHLPEVIQIKKKYKAYLYIDEAHSVGAIGPRGRGVVDYHGCDPRDVDIHMGTFSKSFASGGGYIAGSKNLIEYIRKQSQALHYAQSMAPVIAAQILVSMKLVMQPIGQQRVRQLARNTRYFRQHLLQMGLTVEGNEHSPVIPLLVFLFSKIGAVVRTLRARGIGVIGVGFPATPLSRARIRFCLSAAHTKQQLDHALFILDDIADELGLRSSRPPEALQPIPYDECN